MGETPGEIAAEIEGLRRETDVIIDELTKRARPSSIVHGVTDEVTHRATSVVSEVQAELPEFANRQQPLLLGMGAGALASLGLAAAALLAPNPETADEIDTDFKQDRARTSVEKIRDQATRVRDNAARVGYEAARMAPEAGQVRELGEVLGDILWRARAAQEAARRPERLYREERREPGMVKRVLWVALVSAMATLGSMLFKRLTARVWRGTMREDPPKG